MLLGGLKGDADLSCQGSQLGPVVVGLELSG